jgi:hypothetical protein
MGHENRWHSLWLLIAIVVIALMVSLHIKAAHAHDHARPDLNEWFDKLSSGKGLCCSFADGTVITDADWESKDGHYRVKIDDQWIDVPDEAVITEPNKDGRTMVWPIRGYLGISVRCFMPGSMT